MKSLLIPLASVDEALAHACSRLTSPIHRLPSDPSQPWPPSSNGVLAATVLWAPAWDHQALVEMREQLGSGRLIAVEPVAGLGVRRVIQWMLTLWWRRRLGHHFNRDLPMELRAAGFTTETVDRFTVGRLSVRTYAYMELTAAGARTESSRRASGERS